MSTVLLTVGLSLLQVTTQDTQTTKLEEESKQAAAAAEAGLDVASGLNPGDPAIDIGTLVGGDVSGTAEVTIEQTPTFTTPLISKDSQYTFYLAEYDIVNKQISGQAFQGIVRVGLAEPTGNYCIDSSGKNSFAIELTFMNSGNGVMGRRLIDPCDIISKTNIDVIGFYNETGDEVVVDDVVPEGVGESHFFFARVIAPDDNFEGARLELSDPAGNVQAQGKTITSTANTPGNVTKKFQLFQSFPQWPADFFVTSF